MRAQRGLSLPGRLWFVVIRGDGIIAAMQLSTLGEFGLIELIKDSIQSTRHSSADSSRRIVIDIGDDTAAWLGSDAIQLATTDSLVEDVHFRFGWCTWANLGHKSLAVNLSDIAAMGGTARFALVSLSCPQDVESDSVLDYYHCMNQLASEYEVAIVGGNLTSSPIVTSTVCAIGESDGAPLMTRAAARPGQVVAVTGTLGRAASALALLSRTAATTDTIPRALLDALTMPRPRLGEGRLLSRLGVRCAIDISDGLLSDLEHVCESSGVGATVHAALVPGYEECAGLSEQCASLALTGGEDYELLFTCEPELVARIAAELDCPVSVIGEVTSRCDATAVVVLDQSGARLHIDRPGWRHFAQ